MILYSSIVDTKQSKEKKKMKNGTKPSGFVNILSTVVHEKSIFIIYYIWSPNYNNNNTTTTTTKKQQQQQPHMSLNICYVFLFILFLISFKYFQYF